MGKIWIEICLISARGLRRTSSLWKLQWYAVGWIDPDNKYCTKIDSSGNGNPIWKTKFSNAVDVSQTSFQELALQVEVYSREPIFLRPSLLGTATVVLKEFLEKYNAKSEVSKPVEEVGSFQLRKKNSNKPQGFVDVSIRVSEEREEAGSSYSYPAEAEGFDLTDHSGGINLATGYGSMNTQRPHIRLNTSRQPENTNAVPTQPNYPHPASSEKPKYQAAGGTNYLVASGPSYQPLQTPPNYQVAEGANYPEASRPSYQPPPTLPNYQVGGGANYPEASRPSYQSPPTLSNYQVDGGANYPEARPGYQPPPTPPPPPPPSNVGYIPNFFPRTDNYAPSYINMPPSVAPPGRRSGPGFATGAGVGALAAGAVIFGDDFMSGFDVPSGLGDASLTISTNAPF